MYTDIIIFIHITSRFDYRSKQEENDYSYMYINIYTSTCILAGKEMCFPVILRDLTKKTHRNNHLT